MFGLFTNPDSEMRASARGWLDLADKVRHYRRDQMSDITLLDLQQKTEALRARVHEKADAARLKLAIEELEPVLARTGGRIYPRSTMLEWVEFLVVGLIVILAVRQFFFQPFQIPTNSMWPSYNGMVPEVHATPADEPSATARAFRFFAFGASAYRVDAPVDGEILIPVLASSGRPLGTPVMGRQWLVFRQKQMRVELLVGTTPVHVDVPEDFFNTMNWVLKDTFAPDKPDYSAMVDAWEAAGRVENRAATDENGNRVAVSLLHTGKKVHAGERVLSFDIISGDRLFVDRLSYHFVRPSVGSGFVFRTHNIEVLHSDSYYIKRLAGLPGDTLEIRKPLLLRNGAKITGAQAFLDNMARSGKYRGYFNGPEDDPRYPGAILRPGATHTVSPNGYVALGDNSSDSLDSRYWGEVPKKDAVGRPLWVFYPFGGHWGPPR